MLPSQSEERSHPEDLLEAYAIDALDPEEEGWVTAHLESCSRCRGEVGQWQRTASLLALTVEPREAPERLKGRTLAGLPPQRPARTAWRPDYRRFIPHLPAWGLRNWVVPVAATVLLALLGSSIFLNMRISAQVDQMVEQSSTMTAQLGEAIAQNEQLALVNSTLEDRLKESETVGLGLINDMRKMQTLSYLSAHPDTQPVVLRPAGVDGEHQGVLLVGDGGQKALLMVDNMGEPSGTGPYQVWLVRDGVRVLAGQLKVDASGWGSLNLTPPEPVFMYDSVNLTMPMESDSDDSERLVLTSNIPPGGLLR